MHETEEETGCCSWVMTGPRPITTSSCKTSRAGCWRGVGCPRGWAGWRSLHALIADHLDDDDEPESVLVGIETDRGGWVQALVAAGYTVYAINPKQVARYRERHHHLRRQERPG